MLYAMKHLRAPIRVNRLKTLVKCHDQPMQETMTHAFVLAFMQNVLVRQVALVLVVLVIMRVILVLLLVQ